MSIQDNINAFHDRLDRENCLLVAVSKTKPVEDIMQAYELGHRDFGENKVQELVQKFDTLPKDIRWHMIGHLQRNKVKAIAPFVHLIHAVDSLKLLKEINKQGEINNRSISCLLQIHIAEEQTKFGFSDGELHLLLASQEISYLKWVNITGLMGMATNSTHEPLVRSEFQKLHSLFNECKKYETSNIHFTELSTGMSSDYHIATEEGSTIVRLGSVIFGERN